MTWRPDGYRSAVLIQPPGETEQIECQVGKSPLAESFLSLLAHPALQTAATN